MKHSRKYTGTAYGFIYELYNSFRGRSKDTRRLRKRERQIYKAQFRDIAEVWHHAKKQQSP